MTPCIRDELDNLINRLVAGPTGSTSAEPVP